MILVDTSVWIDYFGGIDNRYTRSLNDFIDTDRIATGDLIIAELMQGFKTKRQIEVAIRIIAHLEYFDIAGKEISLKSAENYRNLRNRGITVRKTIDMLIGTFCIENKLSLLHNDRDFDPMAQCLGLSVIF